jgi:hypothetical protein
MPQEQVLVYLKTTGQATYMHSVDAAEAVRLGDYSLQSPTKLTPEEEAAAQTAAMTHAAPRPPELMTPEEREAVRREANQAEIRRLQKAEQPVPEALIAAAGGMPDPGPEPPVVMTARRPGPRVGDPDSGADMPDKK